MTCSSRGNVQSSVVSVSGIGNLITRIRLNKGLPDKRDMNAKIAMDGAAIEAEEDAKWNAAPVGVLCTAIGTHLMERTISPSLVQGTADAMG